MSKGNLNLAVSAPTHRAPGFGAMLFRCAAFMAGAGLAVYIPFKYATQMHAMQGIYAVIFPFSALLAFAGMALEMKTGTGCSCSVKVRGAFGVLAVSWLVTGLLCVASLAEMAHHSAWGGGFAVLHMVSQHIFLSSVIVAFAIAPRWMSRKLGVEPPVRAPLSPAEFAGARAAP